MGNEIWHSYDEAYNLYALVWRQTDNTVYDFIGGTFATYTDVDIDRYDIPLVNQADSDFHVTDFPTVAAGIYRVQIFHKIGVGIDADADVVVCEGEVYWAGTAEMDISTLDTLLDAIVANLGQVHTTEDESPGGTIGASGTSGIAEGC